MTTIVTPGESLAEQIAGGRDWTCPECGCVFRPGPDDLSESMGMTLAFGARLAIEWYALCPNSDCRSAVTSRWRTAFLAYGPDWAAKAYTPARMAQPAHWWQSEGGRVVWMVLLFAIGGTGLVIALTFVAQAVLR